MQQISYFFNFIFHRLPLITLSVRSCAYCYTDQIPTFWFPNDAGFSLLTLALEDSREYQRNRPETQPGAATPPYNNMHNLSNFSEGQKKPR